MDRKSKPNLPSNVPNNRLFRFSLSFILVACFFNPATSLLGIASPSDPSSSGPAFSIAAVDKMADFPVHWVAAGGGVLASGAGQHVDFALVNEPFSPVSRLSFEGVISGALILGRYAYLSQESLGLRLVDLENPFNPVDLGFYPLSGTIFQLANWGNLLFVGGANNGVQIFELSDGQQAFPGHPQMNLMDRGFIPVEESIASIAADQWKLYVATAGKGIRVYDLSDPLMVVEIEGLPITLPVSSMAVNGGNLFIAAGTEGLHVIDLSTQERGATVATYPGPSESLSPAGRLIYSASGPGGLHLLQAGPIAEATFMSGSISIYPSALNINIGDTVRWNFTSEAYNHFRNTALAPYGIWNSG
jgi:hypothetical protein